MELTQQQATEIAARILDLQPATCDVRLFADEGGQYQARVMLQLGDLMAPDLARLVDQLKQLSALVEAEGLQVTSQAPLHVTLGHRDATP